MRHRRIHVATAADRTSQAVVGGDQVFLQGCTGATLDGEDFVGRGDPAAQAEQAMQNVRTLLEAAGGRVEDICMVTNYTTRHADRAQVYPVIARHLGIPFYVALPSSTIDAACASGAEIPIEERSPDELIWTWGEDEGGHFTRVRTTRSPARNPAFDVTPAGLVDGLITEYGVFPASGEGVDAVLAARKEHLGDAA